MCFRSLWEIHDLYLSACNNTVKREATSTLIAVATLLLLYKTPTAMQRYLFVVLIGFKQHYCEAQTHCTLDFYLSNSAEANFFRLFVRKKVLKTQNTTKQRIFYRKHIYVVHEN